MVYEWWDKGECEESPKSLPSYLKPFANTFGHLQGANCIAVVLFVISKGKQNWLIYEWIHQKTFLEKLKQYHYEEFLDEGLHQGKNYISIKMDKRCLTLGRYFRKSNFIRSGNI